MDEVRDGLTRDSPDDPFGALSCTGIAPELGTALVRGHSSQNPRDVRCTGRRGCTWHLQLPDAEVVRGARVFVASEVAKPAGIRKFYFSVFIELAMPPPRLPWRRPDRLCPGECR